MGGDLGWEAGTTTRIETRYGCFLSDLTGLARDPSTANLPPHHIRRTGAGGKGVMAMESGAPNPLPRKPG